MRDRVEGAHVRESAKSVQSGFGAGSVRNPRKNKKPLSYQGLKSGAGEEGRTPDLMLGKHTL